MKLLPSLGGRTLLCGIGLRPYACCTVGGTCSRWRRTFAGFRWIDLTDLNRLASAWSTRAGILAAITLGMTDLSIVNRIPRSVEKNLNCRRIRRRWSASRVRKSRNYWRKRVVAPWASTLIYMIDKTKPLSRMMKATIKKSLFKLRQRGSECTGEGYALNLWVVTESLWKMDDVSRTSSVPCVKNRPIFATKVMPVSLMALLLHLLWLRLLVDTMVLEYRWQSCPIQDYVPLSMG